MKLMSYNILDGAVNTLSQIIDVVNSEAPDYLTLNEANTFANDNSKILKEFAHATGFPYFEIALSGEMDYHVAVFSKYPFIKIDKLQPLARACIVAKIESPIGRISIASLHLTPYSEDLRHPEIDKILEFQKSEENRILMGDMNSLSKNDNYNVEIVKNFNVEQTKKFTTDGVLRFDAIDKIMSVGYFDSAFELGENHETTVPTKSNQDPAHKFMRLDYIFVSKPLVERLKSYKVIKNELTDIASDHYPITLNLNA